VETERLVSARKALLEQLSRKDAVTSRCNKATLSDCESLWPARSCRPRRSASE